jgi:hypothetical protein
MFGCHLPHDCRKTHLRNAFQSSKLSPSIQDHKVRVTGTPASLLRQTALMPYVFFSFGVVLSRIVRAPPLIGLGYEPVYKPIIPRCSFFDKGHFLALTGMFSGEKAADPFRSTAFSCYCAIVPVRSINSLSSSIFICLNVLRFVIRESAPYLIRF